jgi:hypothetical protein
MPWRSAYSAIHFELGDAADVARVGADHAHGVTLDQILEVLPQVDLLAGVDRRRGELPCSNEPAGVGSRGYRQASLPATSWALERSS